MGSVRISQRLAAIGMAGLMLTQVGCGAFRSHRRQIEQLHATGQYDVAASRLDEASEDLYKRDRLLWELDRGAVSLALNDSDGAVAHLEAAERMIDAKRDQSPDELIAVWLVSERAAPYLVEPFEDLYVNVLKLLAQLEAGRIEGGATVEARRLAWKADHLRDIHQEWSDALDSKTKQRLGREPSMSSLTRHEGEYIESPLGTYLSAITFMESGDGELHGVAARRLQDTIEREGGLIGAVDAADFEHLESLSPDDVDVLIVALSGRGPTKVAERYGPVLIYTVPVYFELPRMKVSPTEVAGVTIEIEGVGEEPLVLIENMARVATENHERHLPLVRARTLLRASAKAVGTAVAAEAARKSSSDSTSGLAALAVALGGLAYMLATEQADLRSWIFLPGQAHVATLDLPEGEHRMRAVYRSAAGGVVYAAPWRTVEVKERGLLTLVEHYWR